MRKLIPLLYFLSLSPLAVLAQYSPSLPDKQYQVNINPKTVNQSKLTSEMQRNYARLDSMYYSMKMDSLEAVYEHIFKDTVSYSAFTLVYGQVLGDMDGLNNELTAAGFPSMNNNFHTFGYFFSFKRGRWLHEPLFLLSAPNSSKADAYEVSVSGGHLSYALGYDILPLERLQLYPMAGLGLQFTTLNLDRISTSGAQTLPEALASLDYAYFTKTELSAFAGAQLDYHLLYSKRKGGIILGLRYTQNFSLTSGSFKDKNTDKTAYQPKVSLSDGSHILGLLKFYGRIKYREPSM